MRALATDLIETYEDKYESVRNQEDQAIRYLSDSDEDVTNFLGDFKQLYPNVTIESIP